MVTARKTINILQYYELESLAAAPRRPSPWWLGYFFAAIATIGTVGVGVAAPFLLVGRLWRAPRAIGNRLFRRGVRILLACQPWLHADVRIAAVQTRVEPVPAASATRHGTLYVSNHRSTLDVFFLLAYISGIRILAKRSLAFVPFLGEVMWLTRQVFLANATPGAFVAAMRQIERGLRAGDHMHVFPEYTRCPPGWRGTQKFSLAPFQIALATKAQIVPIVFQDTDMVWPKGRYALSFRRAVKVWSLPPVASADFTSPRLLMQAVKASIDKALLSANVASVGDLPLETTR